MTKALLLTLWMWTLHNTPYGHSYEMPEVEFVDTKRMEFLQCVFKIEPHKQAGCRKWYENTYPKGIAGLYLHVTPNKVYIHDTNIRFSLGVDHQSFVIHEYVHYLQNKSGMWPFDTCYAYNLMEEEAYETQDKWLSTKDRTIFKPWKPLECGTDEDPVAYRN